MLDSLQILTCRLDVLFHERQLLAPGILWIELIGHDGDIVLLHMLDQLQPALFRCGQVSHCRSLVRFVFGFPVAGQGHTAA